MHSQIIEITNLTKQFKNADRPSLDGISLSIQKGEKFGFFGPNGAGKTTLISILCAILKPTTGSVSYTLEKKQQPIQQMLSSIGFVPQDFAFYPELTPIQNLEYFGALTSILTYTMRSAAGSDSRVSLSEDNF